MSLTKPSPSEHEKQARDIRKKLCEFLAQHNITYTTTYCGERVDGKWKGDTWRAGFSCNNVERSFEYHTGTGFRRANGTAVAPHPADVLYDILSDCEAESMCFDDWCDTLGFNNDSMQDFAIYQACCANAKSLRQVFTRKLLTEVKDLLIDY